MEYFIKNYSIANDTLNKRINIPELEDTIIKSDILASFYQVETNQDILIIKFKTAPSTEDINKLNAIVAAHPGSPIQAAIDPVKIIEEPLYANIDRTMEVMSFELGTDGTSKIITFPYPVVLLGGEFHCKNENIKDRCQLVINSNGVVGVTNTIHASGVTEIEIPSENLKYFARGYFVKFTDGTNVDDLGRIININGTTLTIQNATTREWAIGTQVISEYHPIPHLYFDAVGMYDIGKNSNSGSFLDAGVPIEFRYFHDNGITKQIPISFRMDYYY